MFLVNALLLTIRWMMSSGAMTCPIRPHVRQSIQRSGSRESTNLSLSEDGQEDGRSSDARPSNNQQRTRGVKGRRFDERCNDGLAQSTNSSSSHGGADVPGVPDEAGDDHEREEDVECK